MFREVIKDIVERCGSCGQVTHGCNQVWKWWKMDAKKCAGDEWVWKIICMRLAYEFGEGENKWKGMNIESDEITKRVRDCIAGVFMKKGDDISECAQMKEEERKAIEEMYDVIEKNEGIKWEGNVLVKWVEGVVMAIARKESAA